MASPSTDSYSLYSRLSTEPLGRSFVLYSAIVDRFGYDDAKDIASNYGAYFNKRARVSDRDFYINCGIVLFGLRSGELEARAA